MSNELIENIRLIHVGEHSNMLENSLKEVFDQIVKYFQIAKDKPYHPIKLECYITNQTQLEGRDTKEMIQKKLANIGLIASKLEILYCNWRKQISTNSYICSSCIKITKQALFKNALNIAEAVPTIQEINMGQKLDEIDRERYATFGDSLQTFEEFSDVVGGKRDQPNAEQECINKKKKL